MRNALAPCLLIGLAVAARPLGAQEIPIPRQPALSGRAAPSPLSNSLDDFWWDGFALPIRNGSVSAMAYFGGQILAGGSFTQAGTVRARHIAAWDGSAWHRLGDGLEANVKGIAPHAGGLVAGCLRSAIGVAPTVFFWDGATWTVIGSSDGEVNAVAVFNGDLVVGGSFTSINGVAASRVARWDGTNWQPMSGGVGGTVNALVVHGTQLVAAGSFASHQSVASWDGSTWTQLGAGLQYNASTAGVLALASIGGTLYASGQINKSGGTAVTPVSRWDGSQWSGMTGASGAPKALGERFGAPVAAFNFAGFIRPRQWNGSTWISMGDTVSMEPLSFLTLGSDLYVGSGGATIGATPSDGFVSFDGATWRVLQQAWAPGMAGLSHWIYDAIEWNGQLIATGGFVRAGAQDHWQPVRCIAGWDGSAWHPLGPEQTLASFGSCLAIYQGDLVVGGGFSSAGGVPVSYIARWDGSTWRGFGPGFSSWVWAVASHGTDLVAAGQFSASGATTLNGIGRWDGTAWQPMGSGFTDPYGEYANALLSWGTDLYLGGYFSTVGGVPASNLARWDGTSYHDVGGGVNGSIYALTAFEGDLVVAGEFTQAGGQPIGGVARWNGATWSPMGDNVLLVTRFKQLNGRLFAAGEFVLPDNSEVYGLAMWNGQTWVPQGSGIDGYPYSLEAYQGDLYLVGSFAWANGRPSFNIARLQGASQLAVRPPAPTARIHLSAPSPNPASGPVLVEYSLPAAAHVRLGVFDILGRRVATLVEADRPAGTHAVTWDGRTATGGRVAPGVFILALKAGGAKSAVRMVRIE